MSPAGLETWPAEAWENNTVFHVREGAESVSDSARAWWRGDLEDVDLVRKHRWGGRVERNADYFFKRFSIRSLRYLHKPLRGRRTLAQEQAIESAGLRVPRSVGLIERRRCGLVVESAVISEALDGVESVFELFNGSPLAMEDKREWIKAFAEEVARFHRAGLFHGDLNLNNVLYRSHDRHFFWLDNEEGRNFDRIPEKYRLHDLNHINRYRHNLSLTDRLRLWRTYIEAAELTPSESESFLPKIIHQSQAYWRKRQWL
ncbi:MAG: lipopolysaccharide kinase InaA family protein [Verrucomicrobiota bacterium]